MSSKHFEGVIVQESRSAFISLYEYLKAISMARIVLGQELVLWLQFDAEPRVHPR